MHGKGSRMRVEPDRDGVTERWMAGGEGEQRERQEGGRHSADPHHLKSDLPRCVAPRALHRQGGRQPQPPPGPSPHQPPPKPPCLSASPAKPRAPRGRPWGTTKPRAPPRNTLCPPGLLPAPRVWPQLLLRFLVGGRSPGLHGAAPGHSRLAEPSPRPPAMSRPRQQQTRRRLPVTAVGGKQQWGCPGVAGKPQSSDFGVDPEMSG